MGKQNFGLESIALFSLTSSSLSELFPNAIRCFFANLWGIAFGDVVADCCCLGVSLGQILAYNSCLQVIGLIPVVGYIPAATG
jgi:hypothetical protein